MKEKINYYIKKQVNRKEVIKTVYLEYIFLLITLSYFIGIFIFSLFDVTTYKVITLFLILIILSNIFAKIVTKNMEDIDTIL